MMVDTGMKSMAQRQVAEAGEGWGCTVSRWTVFLNRRRGRERVRQGVQQEQEDTDWGWASMTNSFPPKLVSYYKNQNIVYQWLFAANCIYG